jgi:predicted DCC family thiol-disulfide oxidoreductase YuxK
MLPDAREGWVLYDGACGFCSRWVPSWEPTLQRLGLAIAPLQTPGVKERAGLAADDLLTELRLLRPDGQLISGADVYRFVLRRLWWGYPLYLLSIVPGLRRLFDRGYRSFARHRMQISDACGLAP